MGKRVNIPAVDVTLSKNTVGLYSRIMRVDTPARVLQMRALADFILYGKATPGTILCRIKDLGVSPTSLLFGSALIPHVEENTSGVVEALRYLIHHEHFIKPWSDEHVLSALLTRAF